MSHDLTSSPTIQVNVSESLSSSDSAWPMVVSNFAWQHMKSATIFRREVRRLETEHLDEPLGPFWEEIRSYASSCIMAATASLEAFINEMFIAPNCGLRSQMPDFEVEFWGKNGIEQEKILKKYQLALIKLNKEQFDKKSLLYQDATALIELRNALVHYKPTWDPDRRRKVELVELLKGRFEISPFSIDSADFVTFKCMGNGCATWAVATTFGIMREFSSRTSVDPDKMRGFWLLEDSAK
ncbi:MAG: uncharacterized protein JWL97_4346 [Gemmatimonadales bacterium]|nr:uncharacterized protein [Gemmatimonadales bacterium]